MFYSFPPRSREEEAGARLGDLMKQKIVWKQFENSLTGMFGIKSVSEIAWEQSDMEYLIIMPRPRTTSQATGDKTPHAAADKLNNDLIYETKEFKLPTRF